MKPKSLATAVVHAGEIHDPSGSHTAPIYQTSTFTFDTTADVDVYLAGEGKRAMYPPPGTQGPG